MSGNSATYGGGIYGRNSSSPKVTNCLLARNTASSSGGGVYTDSSSLVITTSTLAGNSAPASSGGGAYFSDGGSPKIINCILWSDSSSEINASSVTPAVTYSDIRGGYTGAGNISDNPSFVNPEAGDYHLRADSPCIDTRTDSGASTADDVRQPRMAPVMAMPSTTWELMSTMVPLLTTIRGACLSWRQYSGSD